MGNIRKYWIGESLKTPTGDYTPSGFIMSIDKENQTATIEVPSDLPGDDSIIYVEEIILVKGKRNFFQAKYNPAYRSGGAWYPWRVEVADAKKLGTPAEEYYAQFR
ncbi:MAG: hypothetical protein HPY66_1680 [Firmicutes bacterium]|nr:hypothetical protein [Bacillota bacterium]